MRRHHRLSNAALCFALCCLAFNAHAQNVNTMIVWGAPTGSSPRLQAQGMDANVNIALMPQGSGNVGIGTTTPLDALSVGTAINASATHALVNLSNTALSGGSTSGTYLGANPASVTADFINFEVGNNSVFKVDKLGNAVASQLFTTGYNAILAYDSTLATTVFSSYGVTTITSGFGSGTAQNIILKPSGSGMVGIGTTSPGYTLQVAGSVAGTSAYNNTSDARLKKDVQPIAYGLDTVMKLRPVGFNWIAQDQDWKKQHQLGLIAQEVEPVIPEVVTTAKDKMQTKSLAYGELTPVVIKAIQELKANQDRLEADDAKLRTEFDAYKSAHP